MQIRYLMIAILVAVYAATGYPEFMLNPYLPAWGKALVYQYLHANLFHLAANCLSLWLVLGPRTRSRNVSDLARGLMIGIAVYFIATVPVVGISNTLFAIVGLRTPDIHGSWWKSPSTAVFLAVTLGMLLFPQLSAVTHICSFIAGAAIAALGRRSRRIRNDIRRATGK